MLLVLDLEFKLNEILWYCNETVINAVIGGIEVSFEK